MENFDAEPAPEERKKFTAMMRIAMLIALVAVLSFTGGIIVAGQGKDLLKGVPILSDGLDATPDPSADLSDFWKAWNTLNARFVQTHGTSTLPDSKEKVWGAIEGLTKSFGDPYTVFMRPDDAKVFAEDIAGNFTGVGMEIGVNKDGILTVIAPLKGTPAEKAGIRSGDLIIAIDEKSTDGMSTDEAVKLIRGEKGTNVVFRIYRDGEPSEITVTRDVINVP
ncbi:MAG TPA: PDZ domain-containing protein, partial [Candidatus Paceibacterota bacterium]|nr:PDZ domain-containing protein [Candidatus Paceibacterota bacterium]